MRRATIRRKTKETEIAVELALDGSGEAAIATGVGFFDHMLEQLASHALFDVSLTATGDLHVDQHHLVEDTGIAFGQALAAALGERNGIMRFADVHLAMDDAMTRVAVDLSGRPYLVWKTEFSRAKIGTFDTELVHEFFQAFAMRAAITLHVATLYGDNNHHICETCFKGVARALRQAVSLDPRQLGRVPSTKGSLAG